MYSEDDIQMFDILLSTKISHLVHFSTTSYLHLKSLGSRRIFVLYINKSSVQILGTFSDVTEFGFLVRNIGVK